MIEQAAIKALHERHNYTVLNCMTEEPDTLPDGTGRKDKKQVVLPDVMLESLCRINPNIPEQTVRTVVDELCHTPVSGDLMLTNYQNYQKIRNGITVEYNKDGKKTSNILRLLSYNDALSNTFTVASQMWISGETHWRRPDLIIFINGFPLVFIELKNSNIPVKNAYDINLKNYLKDIPYLFNYNQICVLSNGTRSILKSKMLLWWMRKPNGSSRRSLNLLIMVPVLQVLPIGLLKKRFPHPVGSTTPDTEHLLTSTQMPQRKHRQCGQAEKARENQGNKLLHVRCPPFSFV